MNAQDKELKRLVDEVESTNISLPPFFELYATVFSILVAIMLFAYPNMIYAYPARLYDNMMAIMPQYLWAFSFLIACLFKSIGLLLDKDILRIVGLGMSVILYGLMTYCYALDFPSIGSVTFVCMTLFAGVSVLFVKHSSIKYKKE